MNYCALKKMGVKTVHGLGWAVLGMIVIRALWELFKIYAGWCCVSHRGPDLGDAFITLVCGAVILCILFVVVISLTDWYHRESMSCSSSFLPQDPPTPQRRGLSKRTKKANK